MIKPFLGFLLLLAAAAAAHEGLASDLCGYYTPQIEAMPQPTEGGFWGQTFPNGDNNRRWFSRAYFAVAEQFSHFGTVQIDGREVPNPSGQFEDSSVTQFVSGYSFTPRFALQVNIPFIYRSFQRPEGFAIERGTESGLGDISLLGKFVVFHKETGGARWVNFDNPKNPRLEVRESDFIVSALLIGGVKFPTGGTERINEEFVEVEPPGTPTSGIHGHDLTLGTGSYDAIIGGQTSLRYRSFFFNADAQFTLRGDGAHQYDFANAFSWTAGPGLYFLRGRTAVVGLQCACSGEHKDVDRFRGQTADDTGFTSVFLGPRVVTSLGKLSGELAVDFPLSLDNTALQVVPDYRFRASFAIRF